MEIIIFICVILVVAIGIQRGKIYKLQETEKFYKDFFIQERNYKEGLVKLIERKDSKLKRKEQTIKFLSDQNVNLTFHLQKLSGEPLKHFETSQIVKDAKVKEAHNRFLEVLQTSKYS